MPVKLNYGQTKFIKMKKLFRSKSTIFLLTFVLFSACLFIYSCSKTSTTTTPTTVEEDKQFITSSFDNTTTCINDIMNGNGAKSLITFLKLSNGNTGNEHWIGKMSDAMDSIWPQSTKKDGTFDYSTYCGTYTWNATKGTFSKSPGTTITIKFPSDSTVSTNDIEATFQSYTETQYLVNSNTEYFPTSAIINIKKAGAKIAGITYSGIFSSGDFPTPQNVSLNINLAPYDYSISVKQLNPTQFTFVANLGCASVFNSTITFNKSDYKNFDPSTYLTSIKFSYTKDNFIINGNWDAQKFYTLNNPNTSDLNTTLSMQVNNGAAKVGDLKFVDVAGNRELFVFYKDGTSANTSFNYNPFLSSVKNVFRPYFGNGVDNWF